MTKLGNVVDDLLNNMFIGPFPSDGLGKDRARETAIYNQHLNNVRGRLKALRGIVASQIVNLLLREESIGRNEEVIERYNSNFPAMNTVMRRMCFFPTKCLNALTAPRAVGHVTSISMLGELWCSGGRRRRNWEFGLHIVVALDLCRLNNFSSWNRFLVARRRPLGTGGHIPAGSSWKQWTYSSVRGS